MTRRQRGLLITIGIILLLWMLHLVVIEPYMDSLAKAGKETQLLDQEHAEAQDLLKWKKRASREWSETRSFLARGAEEDPQQVLLEKLDGIEKRADVDMDVEMKPESRVGDFLETSLDISLETDIRGVRDLLWEFGNCPEFIRVSRFSIGARPFSRKNADRLRVDFRVSMIRFDPGKPSGKNGRRGG